MIAQAYVSESLSNLVHLTLFAHVTLPYFEVRINLRQLLNLLFTYLSLHTISKSEGGKSEILMNLHTV